MRIVSVQKQTYKRWKLSGYAITPSRSYARVPETNRIRKNGDLWIYRIHAKSAYTSLERLLSTVAQRATQANHGNVPEVNSRRQPALPVFRSRGLGSFLLNQQRRLSP
jgi:hypothetical protein